ncbi:MAG: hypothetical protein WC004_04310 [Candidatus Absconditabacterales bacterium]
MKKIAAWIGLSIVLLAQLVLPLGAVVASNLPSFDNFSDKLKKGSERVYDPSRLGVDPNKSLKDNVFAMFYPTAAGGGRIRNMVQVLAAGFFVAMIMYTGIQFIRFADDTKKIENAKNNMLYIAYGGFLIFGSSYLIGLVGFENNDGAASLAQNLQNKILVNIVAFMKAIAFFFAIILIFWNGIQIIQAMDAEEKRKKGITGVINVVAALVFIKLLDFVYYIAQQSDFKSRAVELLVNVSKGVGYVLGALMVAYLIYAGFLMITSNGDDDGYKRATNTLRSIFLVSLVIILFLMIIYQLVKDLG